MLSSDLWATSSLDPKASGLHHGGGLLRARCPHPLWAPPAEPRPQDKVSATELDSRPQDRTQGSGPPGEGRRLQGHSQTSVWRAGDQHGYDDCRGAQPARGRVGRRSHRPYGGGGAPYWTSLTHSLALASRLHYPTPGWRLSDQRPAWPPGQTVCSHSPERGPQPGVEPGDDLVRLPRLPPHLGGLLWAGPFSNGPFWSHSQGQFRDGSSTPKSPGL